MIIGILFGIAIIAVALLLVDVRDFFTPKASYWQ